jgi:protein-disulfide isomerase
MIFSIKGLDGSTSRKIGLMAGILIAGLSLAGCDNSSSNIPTTSGQYKFEFDADDMIMGATDAPVTIVEYASLTCSHCAQFHKTIVPVLKEKYVDTGKARFVFRHYPLDAYAAQASLLVKCAPESKREGLIDTIFTRQTQWIQQSGDPIKGLTNIAREAMISEETFSACARDQKNIDWLQRHLEEGRDVYDINSTPTIYVNGNKISIVSVADLDRIMANLVPAAN